MTDDPKTPLEKFAKFYSEAQWLNIPVTILLLPAAIFWTLLRALWMRTFPARPVPASRWCVVCLSHVYWHHVWQRNHHTMGRLAKRGHPVLYLTPVYLHIILRWPAAIVRWRDNPRPPGVIVWLPPMIPGGSRFPFVDRLNAWLLASEAIGRGFAKDVVLWFYYPAHESIRAALPHRATVYDIQDEYSAFPWSSKSIGEAERRLLAVADVTLPGTHALYERKPPANGNSHFYACGVDVPHFETKPAALAAPPGGAGTGRPRLGYFGAIDNRIDAELLAKLADAHPEWDIEMLGPIARMQFTAPQRPNLHFTGPIPYTELPRWLHGWDIALMPWARNELTEHINPTKTLEYLAARKPVVATAIPDLRKFYSDVLYLADSHEHFIAQCEAALAAREAGATRLDAGHTMAARAGWDSVVGEMEAHVDTAMEKKRN